MSDADMVLMTVELAGARPGIPQAAEALGVSASAVDRNFGVVSVDPRRHLYAVQVLSTELSESSGKNDAFRGPFSNPKIAPFGPTRD